MQAQIVERWGDPSVFRSAEVPEPELRPGHVLVQVAATSVNPVDYKVRQHGPPFAPELPAILHGDVAGTVVAVGEGVDDFAVGDEVYGCAGGVRGTGGALADLMLCDAALLAPRPRSLALEDAAALPLVAITAWEALFDRAQLRAGQTVLVHGGTGGVGHVAVQLAKWAGATVYATVSGDAKADLARELGADGVINYREQQVAEYVAEHTGGRGFDLVLDTVGGPNLERSFEAARLNGTVATIQAGGQHDLSVLNAKGLSLHAVFMLIPLIHNVGRAQHGATLRNVADVVDAGALRPLIDGERFRFADVADAHRRAESGAQIGKVVLAR